MRQHIAKLLDEAVTRAEHRRQQRANVMSLMKEACPRRPANVPAMTLIHSNEKIARDAKKNETTPQHFEKAMSQPSIHSTESRRSDANPGDGVATPLPQ